MSAKWRVVKKEKEKEKKKKQKKKLLLLLPLRKPKTERCPEAWEGADIKPSGSPKLISAWESFYRDRPEDELLSDTMERCIQYCKANGIKPTPPFYEAKAAVRAKERAEAEPDEIARIPGLQYHEEQMAADEAKQKAERELEDARFNALPQEEKLAIFKERLALTEDLIASMKRARKEPSGWMLNSKANLERQIVEHSSPTCQEEILIDDELASRLLSQFPETWDSPAELATQEQERAHEREQVVVHE